MTHTNCLVCPNCGSHSTERVDDWVHASGDVIENTFICRNCPAQYTAAFNIGDVDIDNPERVEGWSE